MLVHEGSPQAEVRPLTLALIDWVHTVLDDPIQWPAPVVAGILHYNLSEVHPVADGNGRTSRLLTTALLMKTGHALNKLADAGVLLRIGDGPARRFRFPNAMATNPWIGRGGGRPREWTDEKIETELRQLVGHRTQFPPVAEFAAAGEQKLYHALVRHGGTEAWSEHLGVEPPRRGSA